MRSAVVAATVALVVLATAVASPVAGQQNSSAKEVKTVDEDAVRFSLGGGVNVVNGSVVENRDKGAIVELTVESDGGGYVETPDILSAMKYGGTLNIQRHRLSEGRTKIRTSAMLFDGSYVAQVAYRGETTFIPVNREGYEAPNEESEYLASGATFLIVFGYVIVIVMFLAWVEGMVVGVVKDADSEGRDA